MSANRTPRAPRRLAAVALAALPLLAACGGGESSGTNAENPVPANPSVTLIGTDNRWDQKTYTAAAGDVSFAFYNKGNVTHSLRVRDGAGVRFGDRLFLSPGKEAGMTVNLAAGTYDLYCDVPGHEAAGMVATLTVTA